MRRWLISVVVLGAAWYTVAPAQAADAETLYQTYCWQCHGADGKGNGINVEHMSVQPRNHTDAEYMGGRSDEELLTAIKDGGSALNKSVLMPPWSSVLSDQEMERLVGYLRELCDCQYGNK